MKTLYCLIIVVYLSTIFKGQEHETAFSSRAGKVNFGIGVGIPYGGIGGRLSVNLLNECNVFAGVGYQLVGTGFNGGIRLSIPSQVAAQFFFTAMYGSNAAIKIEGLEEFNKLYYGPSFGAGLKINARGQIGNYLELGFLIPNRDPAFAAAIAHLRANPRVSEITEPFPFLVFIGYNFTLQSNERPLEYSAEFFQEEN